MRDAPEEWSKEKQQEVEEDHMKELKKVQVLEMSCGVRDQTDGSHSGPLKCDIWAGFLQSEDVKLHITCVQTIMINTQRSLNCAV